MPDYGIMSNRDILRSWYRWSSDSLHWGWRGLIELLAAYHLDGVPVLRWALVGSAIVPTLTFLVLLFIQIQSTLDDLRHRKVMQELLEMSSQPTD